MKYSTILGTAILGCTLCTAHVGAGPRDFDLPSVPSPTAYTFVDLGEARVYGQDADDEQAVVGSSYSIFDNQGKRAVLLRPGVPPQVLGSADSEARAIRHGHIVGRVDVPQATHAARFEHGQVLFLGDLGDRPSSEAHCVSAAGEVGGWSSLTAGGAILPARWPLYGPPRALRTLGGLDGFVQACNAQADMAGFSETPDGSRHATLWRAPAYLPENLETLPAAYSNVNGLSDTGIAVGMVLATQGPTTGYQPFRWTSRQGMVLLAPPPGDTASSVIAVNVLGQSVGRSWGNPDEVFIPPFGPSHAVLWGVDGQPHALESLVPAGTPWSLREAVGIGPHGVIVVTGIITLIEPELGLHYPQPVAGLLIPQR